MVRHHQYPLAVFFPLPAPEGREDRWLKQVNGKSRSSWQTKEVTMVGGPNRKTQRKGQPIHGDRTQNSQAQSVNSTTEAEKPRVRGTKCISLGCALGGNNE